MGDNESHYDYKSIPLSHYGQRQYFGEQHVLRNPPSPTRSLVEYPNWGYKFGKNDVIGNELDPKL